MKILNMPLSSFILIERNGNKLESNLRMLTQYQRSYFSLMIMSRKLREEITSEKRINHVT